MTSAYDTVAERAGVCRDFAHLGIAFCRAIGIPARFCSSYAYGLNPPDFHAYFEAYLGNSWYIFDPTRLAPQTSFVKIGTGHDAADLSFATIIGNANMKSIEITMTSLSTDENNNGLIKKPAKGGFFHFSKFYFYTKVLQHSVHAGP